MISLLLAMFWLLLAPLVFLTSCYCWRSHFLRPLLMLHGFLLLLCPCSYWRSYFYRLLVFIDISAVCVPIAGVPPLLWRFCCSWLSAVVGVNALANVNSVQASPLMLAFLQLLVSLVTQILDTSDYQSIITIGHLTIRISNIGPAD